jgi:hypothetical protein
MVGLFMLVTDGPPPDGGPLLARVEGQLYALAFSSTQRASVVREALGARGATLFYVCTANRDQVERELRLAGARGYIVDFDPRSDSYASAGALGMC